jgi:predicted metal-dependent phosphoesterase TrpH
MALVDLHTHTRFFHGFAGRPTWFDPYGARLLVALAKRRGLDALATTNHDYFERFDVDTGDLTVIPGIEVTSTAGHILVIGPDPPRRTKPNVLTPGEVVDLARERNCAVVLPHPFRNSTVIDSNPDVDAIEVNGKRSTSIERIAAFAADHDRPLIGGSDAHYPFEVGRAHTVVDDDRLTPEGVVAALRNGRIDYRVREWYPSQALRRGYGLIHRLKGHTSQLPD